MKYKEFELDKFQIDAIEAIKSNQSVVVSAPTGSGKTLIADYIINRDVKQNIKVIYTAPIKALSNQKYRQFCKEYGEDKVGLLTGDIVENPTANLIIMTTEIYRNMAIINDPCLNNLSYVIFDEIHYINDPERGYVWEESIIFSPESVRFLCLSATIPNAIEFADWISSIKKHKTVVVENNKRAVPLKRMCYDTELGICTLEKIKEVIDIPDYSYITGGRTRARRPQMKPPSSTDLLKELGDKVPCLYFNFSRAACEIKAQNIAKENLYKTDPEISQIIREKLKSAPSDINKLKSTQILKQTLPKKIGFHHAGLLPIIKELVEELFAAGKIMVLCTTETFAVGINMPAKTVIFDSLRKYDGRGFRLLNTKEYFQIAGRAGRRGIDKIGHVISMIQRRDFEYHKLKILMDKDIEPIQSQFRLCVNTVLNILNQHTEEEIKIILQQSFLSYQKYGTKESNVMYSQFKNILHKLEKLKYVKDNTLTDKGKFASHIFADEILTSEIFSSKVAENLNEYQILLLVCAIVYEGREKDKFYERFNTKFTRDLLKIIYSNDYLSKEKRFRNLEDLTAIIHPIYHGKTFFDMLNYSTLVEGDLIRLLRQIIDRISQIRGASQDYRLNKILDNCKHLLDSVLEEVLII